MTFNNLSPGLVEIGEVQVPIPNGYFGKEKHTFSIYLVGAFLLYGYTIVDTVPL